MYECMYVCMYVSDRLRVVYSCRKSIIPKKYISSPEVMYVCMYACMYVRMHVRYVRALVESL